MSLPAWPVELPRELSLSGNQQQPQQQALRTQMDAGPAKMRRRFTAGTRSVQGSIKITRDQVAVLEGFYFETLNVVLPFTWRNPITLAAATMRFVEPPQYQLLGGQWWQARLALEILP